MAKLSHREIRERLATTVKRLLARRDLPIEFYPYQREAFECMLEWLYTDKGRRRYIAHATGLGKTLEFVSLAAEAEEEGLRFLIIVPNRLLVVQTAKEIRGYSGGKLEVGHISSLPKTLRDVKDDGVLAIKGHDGQRIVIITQQSFGMKAAELAREYAPHVIVRDEMHWSYTTPQLDALNCFPDAVILGWSATPDFLVSVKKKGYIPVELDNGQVLYADLRRMAKTHFEECLHRVTLREGIERQHLAQIAWAELGVTLSMKDAATADGDLGDDYSDKSIIDLVGQSWPTIMEVIRRLYEDNEYGIRDRQVAAVCPNIAMAEEFARVVGQYTRAAVIVGRTPSKEREELLDLFDQDEDATMEEELHTIASVNVLKEGWNSRNVEVLFMLRPTRSRVLYEQIVGRLTRKRRDGRPKTGLIIDPHYQENEFAPLSAPVLYGTPGAEIRSGDILIGPKGPKRTVSPYLPEHVRPKIHVVQPIQIQYWADEMGSLEVDGERWGTQLRLERELGISVEAIMSRIADCRSRLGRDFKGRTLTFYAVKDVIAACADLIGKDIPQTDSTGLVLADEEVWGTDRGVARVVKRSQKTILSNASRFRSRPGKNVNGRAVTLYSLSDAKKYFLSATTSLKVEDGGLAEAEGESWGTAYAVGKIVGVSNHTVKARCKSCRMRTGRTRTDVEVVLYALSDVKKVFGIT